jgi:riboflavin kinase/FMN adenylyltransferase
MTLPQRLEALERAGMRAVAVVRFTHELSQLEPETFVRAVLVDWLHVSEVWVGANFLFGHDRSGNSRCCARSVSGGFRPTDRPVRPGVHVSSTASGA